MRLLFLFLIFITIFAPIVPAGQPFRLKDINPSGDSNPAWLTDVNGTLFFQADDGVHGRELWKSNGTAAGTVMVSDILPGPEGSIPEELVNINGTLYFSVKDVNAGCLAKSDGTEQGTIIVKEMPYGMDPPKNIVDFNGIIIFSLDTYGSLWRSDGTNEGTVMLNLGYDVFPREMLIFKGELLFKNAIDNTIWKTDGTEQGTEIILSLEGVPRHLTDVNGTLFFVMDRTLIKYDGIYLAPQSVKNFANGEPYPANLIDFNDTLFFTAAPVSGQYGNELWKSYGTEPETVMVKDINPDRNTAAGSFPSNLTIVNGSMFFAANDGTNGRELWKTDGTESGTVMIKDINPGAAGSNPSNLTNINGTLYFTAGNGVNGYELWKSDGNEIGTQMVGDIYPGGASSFPAFLTKSAGSLFFSTNDFELWMSALNISNNDDCPNSIQVFSGQTFYGSNAGASGTDLTSCSFNDTADVWFYFKPDSTGYYTINADSGEFDTSLAVFNACGGTQLACSDDAPKGGSKIVLNMIKNKRYYIRVAGFNGQTGNFQLNVAAGYCTQSPAGDLNNDCKVDLTDFAMLASKWMTDLSN